MLIIAKFSKEQLSKIIQSGRFLGNIMSNLRKKSLVDLADPLPKDVLLKLPTKSASPTLDKFEGRMCGQGAVKAGKRFILSFLNKKYKLYY